ncbi:hypothetical protein M378DRAFT_16228 [Amanita muscaria Koide BX008]|uniref:Ubiquitin-like protease family profile domain-containing protein n=1 Tax=Amanita muscaria (strain Koide BX008) TaxID=946122 RepID=A0A0C2W8H8_AMAMK|nr:hypothetical protein M378DRAFT_16228 [Amanita muscaria Koide BX008]
MDMPHVSRNTPTSLLPSGVMFAGSRQPNFGVHNPSPIKKRNKKKTNTYVTPPLQDVRRTALLNRLQELRSGIDAETLADDVAESENEDLAEVEGETVDAPMFDGSTEFVSDHTDHETPVKSGSSKPTGATYQKWLDLLPTLTNPLLHFISTSLGNVLPPHHLNFTVLVRALIPAYQKHRKYYVYVATYDLKSCECQSGPQVLVQNGLFPTAPAQPRIAVSVALLELYHALFERSCDAVNALSSALSTYYMRRGYRILNAKGDTVQDPFRRSLGYAIQWYDCLRLDIDKQVEEVLAVCEQECQRALKPEDLEAASMPNPGPQTSYMISFPTTPSTPRTQQLARVQVLSTPRHPRTVPISPSNTPGGKAEVHLMRGTCHQFLRRLCPACFGGTLFGRSFDQDGGDIHVAVDGNFHHRHLASSGSDTSYFYDAKHFIPKAEVDQSGEQIDAARKAKPKARTLQVPDEAIDSCKDSYHAAKGDQQNAATRRCDINGLMALVCRHDIPLYLADIDTPGEQQKYAVALVKRLFQHLPASANVVLLYDIGCVLDRSIQLYDIIPSSTAARLRVATAAMHAYGHQWACQLVYNPRMQSGLGLTDGEGTERFWSRMRRLIGVERMSARARRVWLIDRQAMSIAEEHRDQLGDWITRRLQKGVEQNLQHTSINLKRCNVTMQELREQWDAQRKSQLSVRAHAPARLKKELNNIIVLQSDLETVDTAISKARTSIKDTGQTTEDALDSLSRMHERLKEKVEALYGTLNVPDMMPEFHNVDIKFVHTLFLARDLKMNIRKRAIGSFLEWERLDQAVGGKGQPLGTKLHQQTRNAIVKRRPALLNAIRKYNTYCKTLEELRPLESTIAIPRPLPTDLVKLRGEDSDLMEDVWVSPLTESKARWLDEPQVREGIRAMLKQDRCLEERRRLGLEADNLCRWFGQELCSLELAIRHNEYGHFRVLLKQRREHLLLLKNRWINPMAQALRFDEHVCSAEALAQRLTGVEEPTELLWLNPVTIEAGGDVGEAMDTSDECDPDAQEAVMADLLADEIGDDVELAVLGQSLHQSVTVPEYLESSVNGMEDCPDTRWGLDGASAIDVGQDMDLDNDSESDIEVVELEDVMDVVLSEPTQPVSMVVDWSEMDMLCDHDLLTVLHEVSMAPSSGTSDIPRVIYRADGRIGIQFDSDDVHRLATSKKWLSDGCINGCASLLHAMFDSEGQWTVFSTHVLPLVHMKLKDDNIWRNTRRTKFWKRPHWIIPIHRKDESHWVLALVDVSKSTVLLFDSFAQVHITWSQDILDIATLISRLQMIARTKGYDMDIGGPWTVRPLTMKRLQTNSYDCGIWVLATITAVLRGFDLPSLREKDMGEFRQIIAHVYRQFSSYPSIASTDMPKRLSQPRIETLPDMVDMGAPASSPGPPSSNAGIDEILEEVMLPFTVQGQRNMYDTLSRLETSALLKEMENRSTPPVTPTPSSSKRVRIKNEGSSPLAQLQLPTRLRMNPTPTKKASQEIRNAIGARKNLLKRENMSSAGSSRASSQSQAPLSVPASGVSLYASENEATPVQSAVPKSGHKTSQFDAAAPHASRVADTPSMSSQTASTVAAASGIQRMPSDSESISTARAPSTLRPLTVQQQLLFVQQQCQGLQQEMQSLIQRQTTSPDPNDAQKMFTLQQQILHAQSQFQALISRLSQTAMAATPQVPMGGVFGPPAVGPSSLSVAPTSMLDGMGFKEVSLPPEPLVSAIKSANPKRTTKAKSTKPTKSQKNPAEEVFAKMGNSDKDVLKQPPSQTDEQSASLAASAAVATSFSLPRMSTPTISTMASSAAVPTSFLPHHTSTPTISTVASGQKTHAMTEPSTIDPIPATSAPSASARSSPPQSPGVLNNTAAAPSTLSMGASMNDVDEDPLLQTLFPDLPAFEPTDMTFADVNVNPEDLFLYPEELQDMLQAEELLVDKRGGRPSSQTLAVVDGELAVMDTKIAELSKKTGISVTNILKRWNTTKTRGSSLWNIYQRYFTANKAEELARLGLDPTTKVKGLVRSQAYVAFRKVFPDAWPEVLEVWAQYAELENSGKSAQQRALAFRRTWRTICGIGESVQRRHGFALAAVMGGNEIHHDHSLVDVYEAKDAKGFFEQRCHADHNKLKGHFKAHIYNVTSKNIVAHDFNEDAEAVIKEEDTAHADLAEHTERPNNRGDIIFEVKQALAKAASKAGLVLNASNLPWAKLLQVCAENNIYIDNYPASVQRPGAPEKGGHSKGIGNIVKQERLDLIKAINAPKNALKFIKLKNTGSMHIKDNTHPVLVYAPPLPGSVNAFSERVFFDGAVDYHGHPRMAGKGPTNSATTLRKPQRQKKSKRNASTPSGDEGSSCEESSSDLDDGPAGRTRSRVKKQTRFVESEDEDNEQVEMQGKGKEKKMSAVTLLRGPQAQGPPVPTVPAKHVPADIEDAPGPSKKSRTEPEPLKTSALPPTVTPASLPMPPRRTLTGVTGPPEHEMQFGLNPWAPQMVTHFPGLMPFAGMNIQPTGNAGIPGSLTHLPVNADMMNVLQMQNMAAMFPGMPRYFVGPQSGMGNNDGH